jgi:hypothetical protein
MNEKNIPRLEINTLSFGNGVQVFDCNFSRFEERRFEALGFGPAFVVEEDPASDDTAVFYPDYKFYK